MDINKLSEPLSINSIEFRVQSVTGWGDAIILAYKNARVDMQRLDEVVGRLDWKRKHVNDNKNCVVSIWCKDKSEWVSKEDTGTESNTEKEKGLASDSFKRACFNWGIGRELYDYPFMKVKLFDNEWKKIGNKGQAKFALKPNNWTWSSNFKDGKLNYLAATDETGRLRFQFGQQQAPQEILDACKNNDAEYVRENWLNSIAESWSILPIETVEKLNELIKKTEG